MFPKNLLTGIIIFMLCSTFYHISLSNFSEYFNYFDNGYTVGLLPMTWKFIPFGLKSSGNHKITPFCFGLAGFVTAISVYGLALYGLKTLVTKDKKIPFNSVETQTEPELKRTNSSYKRST